MELDGYTLVLLLFIFATLFVAGTGSSYGGFAPVGAVADIIMLPLAIFSFLGGPLGLIAAFFVLYWLAEHLGEAAITVALFAFTILLLGA